MFTFIHIFGHNSLVEIHSAVLDADGLNSISQMLLRCQCIFRHMIALKFWALALAPVLCNPVGKCH